MASPGLNPDVLIWPHGRSTSTHLAFLAIGSNTASEIIDAVLVDVAAHHRPTPFLYAMFICLILFRTF